MRSTVASGVPSESYFERLTCRWERTGVPPAASLFGICWQSGPLGIVNFRKSRAGPLPHE